MGNEKRRPSVEATGSDWPNLLGFSSAYLARELSLDSCTSNIDQYIRNYSRMTLIPLITT